jgi:hypothetical protein
MDYLREKVRYQACVDNLAIANNNLPAIEQLLKRLRNDISTLQFQKRLDERSFYIN